MHSFCFALTSEYFIEGCYQLHLSSLSLRWTYFLPTTANTLLQPNLAENLPLLLSAFVTLNQTAQGWVMQLCCLLPLTCPTLALVFSWNPD